MVAAHGHGVARVAAVHLERRRSGSTQLADQAGIEPDPLAFHPCAGRAEQFEGLLVTPDIHSHLVKDPVGMRLEAVQRLGVQQLVGGDPPPWLHHVHGGGCCPIGRPCRTSTPAPLGPRGSGRAHRPDRGVVPCTRGCSSGVRTGPESGLYPMRWRRPSSPVGRRSSTSRSSPLGSRLTPPATVPHKQGDPEGPLQVPERGRHGRLGKTDRRRARHRTVLGQSHEVLHLAERHPVHRLTVRHAASRSLP